VKLLIEHGCDLDLVDANGITAVMYATGKKQDRRVRLLMKAGADINIGATAAGHEGKTALGVAKEDGSAEVLKQLEKVCSACNKRLPSESKKCSRCLRARYCDAACQRAHWRTHLVECKAPDDSSSSDEEHEVDGGKEKAVAEATSGGDDGK
jgi:hypothetical protein